MKRISWIMNAVFAIAIIVLFYLQFKKTDVAPNKAALIKGNMKIAYFEIDSIENNYIYYKELKKSWKATGDSIISRINELEATFNAKSQELQKVGSNLTEAALLARNEELGRIRKDWETQKEVYKNFQVETNNKSLEVRKKIEGFLAIYNKDKAFSYIFSNDPGLMYFKDSAYDITAEVIKGLNEAQPAKK